ncbi:MAG TPA: STAS domain-containing protein [Actinomycetota bacterium]|nr:STAS domain-containing protein [Actinomycetota bacterium]
MFHIERMENPRGLRLQGEMDLASKEAFADALRSLTREDGDITLDLSDLTFIDSTGIQALIKAAENLQEEARLILHAPGKTVLRVFDLMRMDTVPRVEISTGMPDDERT